jgi:hypothetical protein
MLVCRPFRGETASQALSGGDGRGRYGAVWGIFGDPRWLGQNGSRHTQTRKVHDNARQSHDTR